MEFRHRRRRKQRSFCAERPSSLAELQEGETGVVVSASGGLGLVRRLAEMGLTPGVEVKLLRKCPLRGPVEIEVRGVCLALGCGVASKVLVKPAKEEQDG
ncbi:MAG: FeoA family protein [Candidatus Bathyarchaeota archaeon]|nr:FeoA family protein [Candidatus Bathyarchaeota archaeon]